MFKRFGGLTLLIGLIGNSVLLLASDESDTPSLLIDLARAREAREGRLVPVPAPAPVARVESPIPDDDSFVDFDDYQYESAS